MTKPYTSTRIPVRKIPYDELPPLSPDNPFNGYVGPFTTEAELLDRYGAQDLARWQAEYSEFSDAFVRWCAAHPLPPGGITDEPAEAKTEAA